MEPIIYLFFKGNCLEAMTHYADTLGGKIETVFKNRDAPDAQSRMGGGDDLVMNMSMRLGAMTVMASDTPPESYEEPKGFSVCLAPASRAEFDRVYNGLAGGAQAIAMAPAETFWAERSAMFRDKYGTPWMLNFVGNKAAP